jgi:hypothetical protein
MPAGVPRHRAKPCDRLERAASGPGSRRTTASLKPGRWYVIRVEVGEVIFAEGGNPDDSDPHLTPGESVEVCASNSSWTFKTSTTSPARVFIFEVQ